MARDNRTLGRFHLVGLPPAPRGVPQIEVTFDIDANGIVNVSAKDHGTGREQKITITASSGLSKDEVDRMVRDAGAHADEDKRRREVVDARNQADSLAYQAEKTLNESRSRLEPSLASRVQAAIGALRQASQGEDLAAMQRATDDLKRASHDMAGALYAQAKAGSGGAAGSGHDGVKDGEVVDGEYADAK
jgi:molecular chaperone DnaK